MPRHCSALTVIFGILTFVPEPAASADLPDLVITEIFLRSTPPEYENQDVVFIGVRIRNNGADTRGEIAVSCNFACSGHSQRYVAGMALPDGLAGQNETVLGDQSIVDIRGCFFVTQREFTCVADGNNRLEEADETNNALSQVLLTGK